MAADTAGSPRTLVDVVAHKHHQIQILGPQVPVSGVVAVLEVLARAQPEPQPLPRNSAAAGAVRVRPTGLTSSPAMNR